MNPLHVETVEESPKERGWWAWTHVLRHRRVVPRSAPQASDRLAKYNTDV